jgi:phosphoglycolate phosphatase
LAHLALAERDLGQTEAVIFDKDGTLCHSQAYLHELALARVNHAMTLAGGSPRLRTLLEHISGVRDGQLDPAGSTAVASRHDNLISMAAALCSEGCSWHQARHWAERALAAADAQLAPQKWQRTPPTAGLTALLERLRFRGVRIAVLSNDQNASLEAFLSGHGLRALVDVVRGSDNPPHKPDPAAALLLCRQLGCRPEATGLVGDATDDLQVAATAGLAWSLAYTGGWQPAPVLSGSHGHLSDWSLLVAR